jgi:small-conductance mechanosensitive channel
MAEQNLIEQERQILREFRQVMNERAKREAEVEVDFKQKREAAQLQLDQARRQAEKPTKEMQAKLREGQSLLEQNGWQHIIQSSTANTS